MAGHRIGECNRTQLYRCGSLIVGWLVSKHDHTGRGKLQVGNGLYQDMTSEAAEKTQEKTLPTAEAGSGRRGINGFSARLKSCPDTRLSKAEFFSSLFSRAEKLAIVVNPEPASAGGTLRSFAA